jgi:hypothetical protein
MNGTTENKKSSDFFTLQTLSDFFYKEIQSKSKNKKISPLFPEKAGWNKKKFGTFIPRRRDFLNRHFGTTIISVRETDIYVTFEGIEQQDYYQGITLSDIFLYHPGYKCKSIGNKLKKEFCTLIQKQKTESLNGYPTVVQEIIDCNCSFLRLYGLGTVTFLNDICDKLSNFTAAYLNWQKPLQNYLQNKILKCKNYKNFDDIYTTLATILAWLLLAAYLQDNLPLLEDFYIFSSTKPYGLQVKPTYTNKNSICPITLNDWGTQGNTYIERTNLLDQIAQCLNADVEKPKVFLCGMGGLGKSELARSYAWNNKLNYRDIFWITYKKNDFIEVFQKSYSISPNEIASLDYNNLIIVDNYNEYSPKFIRQLTYETGHAHVIVTTRLPQPLMKNESCIVDLTKFKNKTFSYQVFEKNYCLKSDTNETDHKILESEKKDIFSICKTTDYNPMLITLLAIQLREYQKYTISDMAKKLEHGLSTSIPFGSEIPYTHNNTFFENNILSILKIIFEDLLYHDFTMAEKQILYILKSLPAHQLDKDFLFELLGDNRNQSIMESSHKKLEKFGWIQSNEQWTTMHPLIAQIFEIGNTNLLMQETDIADFYNHILKNWLSMDRNMRKKGSYLFYATRKIYWDLLPISPIKLAASSFLDINGRIALFYQLYPNADFPIIAVESCPIGKKYVYYELETKEKITFLDLSVQKLKDRYWRITESPLSSSFLCKPTPEENELLFIGTDNVSDTEFKFFTDFEIPKKITIISNSAFYKGNSFKGNLILSNKITYIGHFAFANCNFSGNLTLPDTIQEMGTYVFMNCWRFTGTLKLSKNLTSIRESTFSGCSGLSGQVVIPQNIKKIEAHAFDFCYGIEKLIFLNPKTIIDEMITQSCTPIICGYPGSSAEIYAKTYKLNFEILKK